jgi:hypothetical protein
MKYDFKVEVKDIDNSSPYSLICNTTTYQFKDLEIKEEIKCGNLIYYKSIFLGLVTDIIKKEDITTIHTKFGKDKDSTLDDFF